MGNGDQGLLNRCMQGDNTAWEAIVDSYGKRLYSMSYRYTSHKEEAEDLTQEIFIRVYQNLQSFRSDAGSFQNWIFRLGRNLIIDHYRHHRRFRVSGGSQELETLHLTDEKLPSPHRTVEQSEAAKQIREALKGLSPRRQEAIILRDLEGMRYREMAGYLGIPEGTVKSRIKRGRLDLARLLAKRRAVRKQPCCREAVNPAAA